MRSTPAHAKPFIALAAAALLAWACTACGGTRTAATPNTDAHADMSQHSSTTQSGDYFKGDDDGDGDDEHRGSKVPSDDLPLIASYGKPAAPADAAAVDALVKRYVTAAAGGDGATVCSLLASSVLAGLSLETRSTGAGRDACARAVAPLLAEQHKLLVADQPSTAVVTSVHVRGDLGLAALGFRSQPQAALVVARERGTWKVDTLFPNTLT